MQGCGRKAIWRENLGGDGVEALETQIGWHRVWFPVQVPPRVLLCSYQTQKSGRFK